MTRGSEFEVRDRPSVWAVGSVVLHSAGSRSAYLPLWSYRRGSLDRGLEEGTQTGGAEVHVPSATPKHEARGAAVQDLDRQTRAGHRAAGQTRLC